jgi:hypothetical protein
LSNLRWPVTGLSSYVFPRTKPAFLRHRYFTVFSDRIRQIYATSNNKDFPLTTPFPNLVFVIYSPPQIVRLTVFFQEDLVQSRPQILAPPDLHQRAPDEPGPLLFPLNLTATKSCLDP